MRPLIPLAALTVSLALGGCADVHWGMERQLYKACQRRPTEACLNNGYLRAGARVLEDPYFGQAPRAPSDLGEPAPVVEATAR